VFEGIRAHLHRIGDKNEFSPGRPALARPRDLTKLRDLWTLLPVMRAISRPSDSPLLQELRNRIEEPDDVVKS